MTQWFESRALQYGDGLFETIAIRNGAPRNWRLHMERLKKGCRVLGLTAPDSALIENDIMNALQESEEDPEFCIAKIIYSASGQERGYGRTSPAANSRVAIFPSQRLPADCYELGVDLVACRTRLGTGSPLAGLKTLNRLEQVMTRSEVLERRAFEGLTFDTSGLVVSGTMSNVFFIRGGQVLTPDLNNNGVRGTMRQFLLRALPENGVAVQEASISENDVCGMDELFLTNSQYGAVPVRSYDGQEFATGPVTRKIMALLAHHGIEECAL